MTIKTFNKNSLVLLCSVSMTLISSLTIAQDCSCTISQVQNNTVNACNYTVGTVVTVTTTSELQSAINLANSSGGNMTILIADGNYQIASTSWYPYMTASNIVFRSLSGNRDAVILTGHGMVERAGTEIGIYAKGNNITIADLTIKEVSHHAIAVTGDGLYVHNVKIQNTYEQMIKGNSGGNGIDSGTVQCSLFEYTHSTAPNWYTGGLDIHTGTHWVVSDNVFKNIASPADRLAEHAVHFWDSSADNTVQRNLIINGDRGIGFGLGSSPNDGGIIRNNMIFNDGTRPFADVGISLESSPNTKVYNNTIHIEYPNAIEYRFSVTSNVEITNNLSNQNITSRNGATATLLTNYGNAQASWYINPGAGNLRLNTSQSTVVDAGTTLAEVTWDIDQILRPQFASFDIGAAEYPQDIMPTPQNVTATKN